VDIQFLTGLWDALLEDRVIISAKFVTRDPPAVLSIQRDGMKLTTLNQKEVNKMIEVNTTWEYLPNIDQQAYGELAINR
jgi:hypothetical protein